jgi:TolB protein
MPPLIFTRLSLTVIAALTLLALGITFLSLSVPRLFKLGSVLAFSSERVSDRQGQAIYLLDFERDQLANLTGIIGSRVMPEWSPDGSRILYRGDDDQLYVISLSHPLREQITVPEDGRYFTPVWSPDGEHIAFTDLNHDVYTTTPGGHDVRSVTQSADTSYWPEWSPDGKRLLFTSNSGRGGRLLMVDADGSNLRTLFERSATLSWPDVSPDGQYLAMGMNQHLYVVDVDGKHERLLPDTQDLYSFSPLWSPDSQRIAFFTYAGVVRYNLYVVNADGSGLLQLSEAISENGGLSWSPDSRFVAFSKRLSNNLDILLADAATGQLHRLTDHPAADFAPAWMP